MYTKPKILIFDEATSALDNINENAFQKSINKIKSNLTLITIAHRMTTIKSCDFVILIDKGKVIAIDNYYNLAQNSKFFKRLALYENDTNR